MENVKELLECPICFELFEDACETNCGHCVCSHCLNKCIEKKLECPVCCKDPTPIHPSYTIRKIVEKYRNDHGLRKEQVFRSSTQKEKQDGNDCYKGAQYAEAIRHYTNAIKNSDATTTITVDAPCYANRGNISYILLM
jgi:hypothetical protein